MVSLLLVQDKRKVNQVNTNIYSCIHSHKECKCCHWLSRWYGKSSSVSMWLLKEGAWYLDDLIWYGMLLLLPCWLTEISALICWFPEIPLIGLTLFLMLLYTTIINNMESKRERVKENRDTYLLGSAMCLHPHESAFYFIINDLGLQSDILIREP